jgi:hypothetical protein
MEFQFKLRMTPRSPAELGAHEQAQLRAAALRWDGQARRDLTELFASGDAEPELWDVLRDGRRVYDAWLFHSEDGCLFEPGTAELAPVHVIHGDVSAVREQVNTGMLRAVQRAFDARFEDDDD